MKVGKSGIYNKLLISKGLLLVYCGIVLLPFLLVAGLRDFEIRHPREMVRIINEAKEF